MTLGRRAQDIRPRGLLDLFLREPLVPPRQIERHPRRAMLTRDRDDVAHLRAAAGRHPAHAHLGHERQDGLESVADEGGAEKDVVRRRRDGLVEGGVILRMVEKRGQQVRMRTCGLRPCQLEDLSATPPPVAD